MLEKRRKDLRAEMGEDEKRRKELVKMTRGGKPSKGSIDWMRAQGMNVREFEAELAGLNRSLAPLVEEAEGIDAMLVPYEAIKEELKAARATLRQLKAAFVERLAAARAELDNDGCRELVLDIDRERLGNQGPRCDARPRSQCRRSAEGQGHRRASALHRQHPSKRLEGAACRLQPGAGGAVCRCVERRPR